MRVQTIRDIAAAVRGRRQTLGWSQAELAERAGVSRKWIYEFERGSPNAALGHVLRVAEALGLRLDVHHPADEPGAAVGTPGVDLDRLLDEYGPHGAGAGDG